MRSGPSIGSPPPGRGSKGTTKLVNMCFIGFGRFVMNVVIIFVVIGIISVVSTNAINIRPKILIFISP